MNTTSQQGRAAAIAAITLLFVLPLAACQTAVPGSTVQIGNIQPTPKPIPAPAPTPIPTPAPAVSDESPASLPLGTWRTHAYKVCIDRHLLEGRHVVDGVPSVELAKAQCMSKPVAVPQ